MALLLDSLLIYSAHTKHGSVFIHVRWLQTSLLFDTTEKTITSIFFTLSLSLSLSVLLLVVVVVRVHPAASLPIYHQVLCMFFLLCFVYYY